MKHEIEIEGLPEGFEVKEVLLIECESNDNDQRIYGAQVIVKKKQPRRIVLEETENDSDGRQQVFYIGSTSFSTYSRRVWKQVK